MTRSSSGYALNSGAPLSSERRRQVGRVCTAMDGSAVVLGSVSPVSGSAAMIARIAVRLITVGEQEHCGPRLC